MEFFEDPTIEVTGRVSKAAYAAKPLSADDIRKEKLKQKLGLVLSLSSLSLSASLPLCRSLCVFVHTFFSSRLIPAADPALCAEAVTDFTAQVDSEAEARSHARALLRSPSATPARRFLRSPALFSSAAHCCDADRPLRLSADNFASDFSHAATSAPIRFLGSPACTRWTLILCYWRCLFLRGRLFSRAAAHDSARIPTVAAAPAAKEVKGREERALGRCSRGCASDASSNLHQGERGTT